MSNPYNKITVIDLEATCWEDKEYQQEYSEIIEIGCAELNLTTGEIGNNRSIYVKPFNLDQDDHKYPIISDYCVDLTGITKTKLLKQGKYFGSAIEELKKYYPTSKTWVTWGVYDLVMLEDQCEGCEVEFPFRRGNHINLKNLFGLKKHMNKSVGLMKALDHLGMEFEGKQHSGKCDAYNTAKIAREILC